MERVPHLFHFLKEGAGGVDVGEEANSAAAAAGEAGRKRTTR